MKKLHIFYPFSIAIYPALYLYSHNLDQVFFSQVAPALAAIVITVFAMSLIVNCLLRDLQKTSLLMLCLICWFFLYGPVSHRLTFLDLIFKGFPVVQLSWHTLWLVICVIVLRTRLDLTSINRMINVVSIVLIAVTVAQIIHHQIKSSVPNISDGRPAEHLDVTAPHLPNVFFIILDSYPAAKTLEQEFGYNNTEFIDFLTSKGFYVASNSRSNYAMTFLSLAATLNMDYINNIAKTLGTDSKERDTFYLMIQDSAVSRFFRGKGYRFVNISSGWGPTDKNPKADETICGQIVNEFTSVLLDYTVLRGLKADIGADSMRKRILCAFSHLARLNDSTKPTFVFAHIFCPHPPYLFNADGTSVQDPAFKFRGDPWSHKKEYLAQLVFTNNQMKQVIKCILEYSHRPAVVIIQGDHGPATRIASNPILDSSSELELFDNVMIQERMSILNAILLPEKRYRYLYQDVSPVNTFRIVLNSLFETRYSLLPDQSWFSWYEKPFKFYDVTSILK